MPDLETSLTYCTYCPKLCRHTCPVSNAEPRESIIPQAKMATLRQLRTLAIPNETRAEMSEALYACSGCGACTEFCRHSVETGPALFGGRADAEREGHGHPTLAGFAERWELHSRKTAGEIAAQVPRERRLPEARVAFMPGCDGGQIANRALALFDRIDASYVTITAGEHSCGGYPILAAGLPDRFRLHAERMAVALAGYSEVVVNCPSCAFVMKGEYKKFGVPLKCKITNTSEFLEPFIERMPVTRPEPAVFYHDPCYLGRQQGVYDAPRRALEKSVGTLHEFSQSRENAECSGGGGLLPLTMPETSEKIAEHRLKEVRASEVRTVVTGCPTCKRRLGGEGVRVLDLVEHLANATDPL